jgi:hypothetical protein
VLEGEIRSTRLLLAFAVALLVVVSFAFVIA